MSDIKVDPKERTILELEKWHLIFHEKEMDAYKAIRSPISLADSEQACLQLERMLAYSEIRQLIEDSISSLNSQQGCRTYIADSMFLYDSFRKLTVGPDECMHYVTGPEIGNFLVLDRIVEFELDSKSPIHANGDLASSHRELIKLHTFGHRLHALFHCHPGVGVRATSASSIDKATQERQEKGKYPVIGGIFSRDGYIRFYAVNNQFRILVYGEGVEKVDENVFCLSKINEHHR